MRASAQPEQVSQTLILPPFETLTADQRRGAVCVWGDERLHADTAVDLGERTGPAGRWWPRACRPHAAEHGATSAGLTRTCERCWQPIVGEPVLHIIEAASGPGRALYFCPTPCWPSRPTASRTREEHRP